MNKTATIQLRNLTIGYKGKVRPKIVAEIFAVIFMPVN